MVLSIQHLRKIDEFIIQKLKAKSSCIHNNYEIIPIKLWQKYSTHPFLFFVLKIIDIFKGKNGKKHKRFMVYGNFRDGAFMVMIPI